MHYPHKLKAPVRVIGLFFALAWPIHADALPINGITVGGTDKGFYMGLESGRQRRNSIEFGALHFDSTLTRADIGLSKSIPVRISENGIRLAYNSFINGDSSKSGLFAQASLIFNHLNTRSRINASSLSYSTSGVQITCKSCGDVTASAKSGLIDIVPAIGIGWQAAISKKLILRANIGAQYYNLPDVKWQANAPLPGFARNEITRAIKNLNSAIDSSAHIYPTAILTIVYHF